jgi:hypothetical protein
MGWVEGRIGQKEAHQAKETRPRKTETTTRKSSIENTATRTEEKVGEKWHPSTAALSK